MQKTLDQLSGACDYKGCKCSDCRSLKLGTRVVQYRSDRKPQRGELVAWCLRGVVVRWDGGKRDVVLSDCVDVERPSVPVDFDLVYGVSADKLRPGLAVYKHFCGDIQVGIITVVNKTSLRYVSLSPNDSGAQRSMSFSRRADARTGVCVMSAQIREAFTANGVLAQSALVLDEQLGG